MLTRESNEVHNFVALFHNDDVVGKEGKYP